MSLLLNEEQRMLRDSAAEFLGARSPIAALRKLRDTRDARGWDEALWREITELDWPAAVLPEEHGGLGIGWAGLGAVFEQIGRTLAATPLLSTVVLGAGLIERLGSDAQRSHWLPRIAAGETVLALALDETPRHDPARIATRARRDGAGWVLDGEKWFVLDGHVAERLLVVARTDDAAASLAVFLVDPAAPGVELERTIMVDSRNAARLRLAGVALGADALLGTPAATAAALDAVLDRARACLAAEALGVIREAFDRSVAYLKERVQFGVAIGSFQALQHRAARLFVDIELLHSAVAAALEAFDTDAPDAGELASLAKARAGDLSERALNEAAQLHGGIGVTDELDIGLMMKRGRALQQTFGDGAFHRRRYAALLGFAA